MVKYKNSYLLFFFDKVETMILTGVIWSARTVWFSLVHINHDEENTVWSLTLETRT